MESFRKLRRVSMGRVKLLDAVWKTEVFLSERNGRVGSYYGDFPDFLRAITRGVIFFSQPD